MQVMPRQFQPGIHDFLRQVVGCANLGCIFPFVTSIAILVALASSTESTPQGWWESFLTGFFIGFGIYIVFVAVIAAIKRRNSDIAESKAVTADARQVLSQAIQEGDSARNSATYGGQWVDQAFIRFEDREYVPFWEAVEHSETYLRRCCESLALIQGCRIRFAELLSDRDHSFPDLDEKVGVLIDPRPDMHRLAEVVRKANRLEVFSMILAQRATTNAVKEGFRHLTDAVHQLERSVTASLDDLKKSVVTEIRSSTFIQAKILQGIRFETKKQPD